MVDARELRIGNLIINNFGDQPNTVSGIVGNGGEFAKINFIENTWEISNRNVEPIPITPEWLERFGLMDHSFGFSKVFTVSYYDDIMHIEQYNEGPFDLPHIKYVHQLQNLYHALTGHELTVKELNTAI